MRVSNITVRKRLIIGLFVGLLVFLIIDVRLGYVQIVLGKFLTDTAKGSLSRNIPFEPNRGEIVDRNGVPLATNISAPTVWVVPKQIKNPAETSEKLASVLPVTKEAAYREITQGQSIIRLKKGVKFHMKRQKK
ncbi:cell division protein FtsI/penicillin-binding protein 2 [Neobacillus niacini]|nr:cell division protein FtsI/penicillin-binding protein 2 [Neobacillus niacini]